METAVLDACVLFRGGVRDFLLWVAEAGAFSEEISAGSTARQYDRDCSSF